MLIPDYWAESNLKQRFAGKQFTVHRFGWSEESLAEAQRHADTRAEDAMARLLVGEKLERREPKVAYNGAFGVPIREEVLSRHGDTVITRNLYGARCLNTPDVLFADIDFDEVAGQGAIGVLIWLIAIAGFVLMAGMTVGNAWYAWLMAMVVFVLIVKAGFMSAASWLKSLQKNKSHPEQAAIKHVEVFLMQHPNWRIRLYRTPAGLRLLVMHQTFDPGQAEVANFFDAIGADKIYVRMCLQQNCFRARVSPKPWRIGITSHMKPRPGIWPIKPERLPEREQWVNEYERKSEGFASCGFIADMGSNDIDPTVERVRILHDDLCHAESGKPLA
jgi:hypothetical protein